MQGAKTQYYTAASLDGFIATKDDSLDWLLQFTTGAGDSYETFIRDVGAIAMGSATYEWLLRNHLRLDSDKPQPWPYDIPSWVFTSRQRRPVPGADVRFVAGDVAPVHRQMAEIAAGRNVWVAGGGELAGQFYDAGLLDELIVQVTSVTLGAGKPLFPRAIQSPALKLTSVVRYGDAFAELRYELPRPGR
ncbi:deaminase [Opitutaceae bacterium EW11]|nr:deaminase [Opitutaceae bacterium EW11]